MKPMFNYRFLPSTVGIATAVCLIVRCLISVFMSGSAFADAANTVLAILSMAIAVHLIRSTAGMLNKHVWESIPLIFLLLIPVFNLLITTYNILFDAVAFMDSEWFIIVLLALSFPSFFCYFFLFVYKEFTNDKRMKAVIGLTAAAVVIYVLPRLLAVFGVTASLITFLASNSYVSLAIYVIELICFIISGFVFRAYAKSESEK